MYVDSLLSEFDWIYLLSVEPAVLHIAKILKFNPLIFVSFFILFFSSFLSGILQRERFYATN